MIAMVHCASLVVFFPLFLFSCPLFYILCYKDLTRQQQWQAVTIPYATIILFVNRIRFVDHARVLPVTLPMTILLYDALVKRLLIEFLYTLHSETL
jgi:hypothetical protein